MHFLFSPEKQMEDSADLSRYVGKSEGMHCLGANSLWGSVSLLFSLLSQGALPSALQNCENKSELVLCLQTPRLSVGL